MATRDLDSIFSALAAKFQDKIASQIERQAVLAQLLQVRPGQGKNLQWDVSFGTQKGAAIADGADVTVFNQDDKVPAILQYAEYSDAFAITTKALAAARAAGNPAQLANAFLMELKDSSQRLAKIIAEELYIGPGGTSPHRIHGLTDSIGGLSDSGIYAGINRATYAQWASNVTDLSGDSGVSAGVLTFAAMRAMRTAIGVASGQKPDLIVCSPDVHDIYGALFGSDRRHTSEVYVSGRKIILRGGYMALEFDGIPVISDVNCPAETMLFLNTDHVYLSQLPDNVNSINRAMMMTGIAGTSEEQYGDSRLPIVAKVQPLAIGGQAFKFQLHCMLQLCVSTPNACGQLTFIDS